MKKLFFIVTIVSLIVLPACEKEEQERIIIDFEEFDTGPDGFLNGSGGEGGFISEIVFFPNSYNSSWDSWSGFSITSNTDTETGDYSNMYSAIPGTGDDLSDNYATYYFSGIPDTILFEERVKVSSLSVTNTTYAYYTMLNGNAFSKKFGGEDGSDPDWFRLVITSLDHYARPVTRYNVYLADYRSDDESMDYISDVWNQIDLSDSGYISGLVFFIESSDTGEYGINTPAYVSIDNLELILLPAE
jgi:hypothetical protein